MIKRITVNPYLMGTDQRILFLVEYDDGRGPKTLDEPFSGKGSIKLLSGVPGECFEVMLYRRASSRQLVVSVEITFADGIKAQIEREYQGVPIEYDFKHKKLD